jgi:hypothetical protein
VRFSARVMTRLVFLKGRMLVSLVFSGGVIDW